MSTAQFATLRSASTALFMVLCAAALLMAEPAFARDGEEAEEKNVLSLILGGTSDRDENVFTIGLDYEHRLHPRLGIGAVIEYATDDLDALTLIGALDLHIWKGLAIQTGPGVEFAGEEEEEDGLTTTTNRRSFIYRVGVVYEFEIGRLLLIPQVHYDYSSGNDAVVYATGIGFKF